MTRDQAIVLAYGLLYLAALLLAIKRRKTFPLAESLMVMLIVGGAFTGLVFIATLPIEAALISAPVSPSELIFTFIYLLFTAIVLVLRPAPNEQAKSFLKIKIASLGFKLSLFVLIPLTVIRLVWRVSWADLGFNLGASGQWLRHLGAAALLMLFFGGFNAIAGSGAAPIRARQFSRRQVILGLGIATLWNLLETGLVEEFFFRAFLQTRMIWFSGSPLAGICLTSLLFGLAHAPGLYLRHGDRQGPLGEHPTLIDALLYAVLMLSTAGWFTGLLYWRTQSLLAPILVHAAIDAVAHAAEFIRGVKLPE